MTIISKLLYKEKKELEEEKEKKKQNVVAFNPMPRKILDHVFNSMLGVTEKTTKKNLWQCGGCDYFFDFYFL